MNAAESVRLEFDIPGVTSTTNDLRERQVKKLLDENNALRDRVAFLERRIAELEGLEPTR